LSQPEEECPWIKSVEREPPPITSWEELLKKFNEDFERFKKYQVAGWKADSETYKAALFEITKIVWPDNPGVTVELIPYIIRAVHDLKEKADGKKEAGATAVDH
jgi:hypothetical protein